MDIRLRPWTLEDIPALSEQINNIRIWNNVRDGLPFPYTEKDAYEFISMTLSCEEPQIDFAIEANGKVVGGIGIVPKEDVERISVEIGYWMGEKHWGKGIATQAVKKMVNYTFRHFEVTRIYAGVFEYNKASMRVLEKTGFEKEAVLKKAVIKNGKIIDFHQYAYIKS